MSSEICRLSDFATIQGGYAFKSADFSDEGVAVVKIANIQPPTVSLKSVDRVSSEKLAGLERFQLKDGDILMAMTGATVGKVGRFTETEPAFLNQRVARIKARKGELFDDYIYAVVSQPGFDSFIEGVSAGSAQPNISAAGIGSVQIFHIPEGMQILIGSVARALDDRINLLRDTNATLEAIVQALFKSWFVDFDPVRAKMEGRVPEGMDEATAALFPDEFVESELGAVPRGWSISSLGDSCAYLSRGLSPKYLETSGVLVLNQKCIRDYSVDYSKGRRHDSVLRKVDGRELELGDMLVNSTGVGTLGRVAQILELPEATVIVDSHVTVLRAGPNLSWPYLGQVIARKQSEIETMGEGSTGQTELSRAKLASIPILVPLTELLTAFDKIVMPLKQRVAVNEANAKSLARLRDTLLPRLISGQLRLPEAMEAI